jgi:molecular chaperone DnaK (HSP70)
VEVIAKTGQSLGGADIDRWIWEDISQQVLFNGCPEILMELMERIKVTLSSQDTATEIFYDAENLKAHSICYSRKQLEQILRTKGFYRILQTAIDEVINRAVGKGILKMDIRDIVLVGGSTLIPSVQSLIRDTFPRSTIHSDRPFEAVVYGALWLNQGLGIRDHLFHDYAIRFLSSSSVASNVQTSSFQTFNAKISSQLSPKLELNPVEDSLENPRWQYQSLFQRGQAYPTKHPCEIILRASQPDQAHIDLVIGELEKRTSSSVEVIFQGDRLISEVNNQVRTKFLPLTSPHNSVKTNQSESPQLIIPLNPLGQTGIDRLRVIFEISDRRQLIVTVVDLLTEITLFKQIAIADLR